MADVGEYNGHQYPWIGFDELTEHPTGGPYEFMIGCCRSAYGAPCRIRSTGNPGRPGHGWVKARFVDVAHPFELYTDPETGLTRCFIPSRLEDNKILIANDPDYERRLLHFEPHLRKALRYGDWSVVIGQVLSEFSSYKHVIRQAPLDQSWYKFAALDWGFAKPFAVLWFAVDGQGRVILYREWYGSSGDKDEGIRLGSKALAKKAWDMSVAEGVTTMVADPSIWQHKDEGATIAEYFEEVGWTMVKGENDRIIGLQKVHEYLQGLGMDGRPMFLVMENCHHWIRTVPYLCADPSDPEDINTDMEDHAYDATRYALMSEFTKKPHLLRRKQTLHPIKRKPHYDPMTYGIR
jgi:hypothetical protein